MTLGPTAHPPSLTAEAASLGGYQDVSQVRGPLPSLQDLSRGGSPPVQGKQSRALAPPPLSLGRLHAQGTLAG